MNKIKGLSSWLSDNTNKEDIRTKLEKTLGYYPHNFWGINRLFVNSPALNAIISNNDIGQIIKYTGNKPEYVTKK